MAELRDLEPSDKSVAVLGWISAVRLCSECSGTDCERCTGDRVVLSEEDKVLKDWELTESDVVVFIDPERLAPPTLGTHVRAMVKVQQPPSPSGGALYLTWEGSLTIKGG